TAVSALALVERRDATNDAGVFLSEARGSFLSELIVGGINWLANHQNPDGGWGDTDKSHSNIATTMLAVAAFHLTGVPVRHAGALERAQAYIDAQGGAAGLKKRYGKDKTFAVPILTNCALAGMVPWSAVSPLPFELACLPQKWYRFLRLPVVSYAIPALVAIGQCRHYHKRPLNPIVRAVRNRCVEPSLTVLRQLQPSSGGFLEAIPLTSFVVMSLASMGRVNHPVTQAGLEFIVESVREDGSWPIDTDLATWNTTLAVNALAAGGEDVAQLKCLPWLLDCQQAERHPFTGAEPGGWGWSDLSGAVPDADDTAGALLALARCRDALPHNAKAHEKIQNAAQRGLHWLLSLQNSDGGWPTFCRGWGALPFDRSGADLTAHALRAIHAWRTLLPQDQRERAVTGGLGHLFAQQRPEGKWAPLWFGNQDDPQEENPVYGTAKVLSALLTVAPTAGVAQRQIDEAARRGVAWLLAAQNPDGGWGGRIAAASGRGKPRREIRSSTEETALAVDALMAAESAAHDGLPGRQNVAPPEDLQASIARGLEWLVRAVEENRHRETSPIGFYFAKLWYYERLYPITFTVSALGHAMRRYVPPAQRRSLQAHLG
ncbi:MAG: squalene--hopene cyclase, partial [Planctomycetales bacterium]|nr:squalene--hopene cyclase [Planctomycetales bacterium]